MSLDMGGHIDACFQSTIATRTSLSSGSYVAGRWVGGSPTIAPHVVNLQPLSDKEIDFLKDGGERVLDARKIYVNDGDLYSLGEKDTWVFDGVDGVFKTVKLDKRPWRNYCKIIVSRIDDQ